MFRTTTPIELKPNIELWPEFISETESQALFDQLESQIRWRRDEITLFGKRCKVPRLQAFIAQPGIHYTYSGLTLTGEGIPENLATLNERIEQTSGYRFNAILVNLYRDGSDSMGWHSDDEPELGSKPAVAILSLGATRTLRFQDKTATEPSWGVDLSAGSLLVMHPGTQERWKHSLPRRTRVASPRISLTYRLIIENPH